MTRYTITVDGDVFEVEIGPDGQVWVNEQPYDVDLRHVSGSGSTSSHGEYSLLVNNRSYEVHVADSGTGHPWVMVSGHPYRTRLQRSYGEPSRSDTSSHGRSDVEDTGCAARPGAVCPTEVRAPLPGLLVELRVRENEHVQEQQVVAVVESMKMNLEVRAPREGVVRDLCAVPGRQVAQDEVLAILGSIGTCFDE